MCPRAQLADSDGCPGRPERRHAAPAARAKSSPQQRFSDGDHHARRCSSVPSRCWYLPCI